MLAAFLGMFFALGLTAQTLVLNEVVSSNSSGLEDEDGDRPDWVEIHNPTSESIELKGYGLSDKPEAVFRWKFPSVLLGPGRFLVVFASGKDRLSGRMLHTNFRLGADGEALLLTHRDGSILDRIELSALQANRSYGRHPQSGRWVFFDPPTPGASNTSRFAESLLDPPSASHRTGRYDRPFDLQLFAAEPGSVIRYTLDGSDPSEDSLDYRGAIGVRDRTGDPDVLARISGTSTNNQHTDGWKPPRGLVRKATVIRARVFREGALPSPDWYGTFVVGALPSTRLPIASLQIPAADLYDFDRGIYVLGRVFSDWRRSHPVEPLTGHTPANYTQRGLAWQRAALLEWFEPGGRPAFEARVEIDIQGQSSRSFRQKSLGVKARSGTMDYAFVPGLVRRGSGHPLASFRSFRLRNSGNDWAYSMFRDALCHRMMEGLPIDGQGYRPAVVFLNGEYWGIHNWREQHDADSLALHYGLDPRRIVICHGAGGLEEGPAGAESAYRALLDFARTADLSREDRLQRLRGMMDVENFLLYQAGSIYLGNADWPHNNVRVWRDSAVSWPVVAEAGEKALGNERLGSGRQSGGMDVGDGCCSIAIWRSRIRGAEAPLTRPLRRRFHLREGLVWDLTWAGPRRCSGACSRTRISSGCSSTLRPIS